MLSVRVNALFTSRTRKLMAVALITLGFLFLLLMRCFQSDIPKIVMLYAALVCAIHLVVLYKNSLNKYEIGIFCFLCFQLLSVMPNPAQINNLVVASYLLSYRYGISSRSLIATIVDFFANNYISKYFVGQFIFCSTVYLSFIISVYLGGVINKAEGSVKTFLIFVSFLYLSSFTAPVAYFIPGNFGRLEIYGLLFMLLLIHIIHRPVVRWLIPLLALLVLATHIILILFYIPFVVIMLFFDIFSEAKKDKRTIFLLIITVIVISLAFLCYLLFYKKSFAFEDAHGFYNYLSTKSDLIFREDDIHMLMFAELKEHINKWKAIRHFGFSGNFSVLINIPLVFLFVTFWLKCFFTETKKPMKLFFLLPVIALPYHSLVFFMFFDFGRWMIMILNVQFMLFFYMIYMKNEIVLLVVGKAVPFVEKNKFFLILICFIMVFLGPVSEIGPSGRVMRLVDNFFRFF